MRTFFFALALTFAVIGGTVAVSALTGNPARAGDCTTKDC
jgi:hypothetical protein